MQSYIDKTEMITICNRPNIGQVSNLPMGAIVETKVKKEKDGSMTPIPAGELPRPIHQICCLHTAIIETVRVRGKRHKPDGHPSLRFQYGKGDRGLSQGAESPFSGDRCGQRSFRHRKGGGGEKIMCCIRYSPVALKTDSFADMQRKTEDAIRAFFSDEHLCFSCVGIDGDVPMEKVREYLRVFGKEAE